MTTVNNSGFRRLAVRMLKLLGVILLLTVMLLGWRFYRTTAKLTGTNNPFGFYEALKEEPLKSTDGKTSILLAGYSVDDPNHEAANLTDSIMVITIDQNSNTSTILSIPRDLYVNIPDYGYSKINAAYQFGEANDFKESGYAPGGMGLLEKIVTDVTGVDFNYYGLINYTAFKNSVDAVDGVTITIKSSDKRGVYEPYTNLKLANGPVKLNGQQALNLARARGAGRGSYGFAGGDFERTGYQQEILLALKDKASSPGVLSNPFNVSNLYDTLANNVKSDLRPGEARTIFSLSKKIGTANIKTISLNNIGGNSLLVNSTTSRGQSG